MFCFIPSIICIFEGCFCVRIGFILFYTPTLIFCCCVSLSWFGVHDPCGGGVHSPGRHPFRPRPVPSLSSCLRLSSRSVSCSWILTLFRWGRCQPGRGCGDSSPLVLTLLSPMDYVRPSVSWGWLSVSRETLGQDLENIE